MKLLKIVTLTLILISFTGCLEGKKKEVKLDSDEAKFSYAVGYEIGRNMKRQNIQLNYDAFETAVIDVMENKEARLNDKQRREVMKAMSEKKRKRDKEISEENKVKGKAFLESNKTKEGIQVTASGLQYKMIRPGEGPKPTTDDIVKVHYKGTLIDGTQFDSSYERNEPADIPIKAVIPGWTEGLQLMNVGSKYELYIPSELGYGARRNPSIPGNSVLIFEVELLSIKNKEEEEKAKEKKKGGKPKPVEEAK